MKFMSLAFVAISFCLLSVTKIGAQQVQDRTSEKETVQSAKAPKQTNTTQEKQKEDTKEQNPPASKVSIISQDQGMPVLQVNTTWKSQNKPSIRVVLLQDKTTDIESLAPIQFEEKNLAFLFGMGDLLSQLNSQLNLDKSQAEIPTKDGGLVELFTTKNALGKTPRTLVGFLKRKSDNNRIGAMCVFFDLEKWASNDSDKLLLESPVNYFSDPGKLRVWFFSGESSIWSETLNWPGKQKK